MSGCRHSLVQSCVMPSAFAINRTTLVAGALNGRGGVDPDRPVLGGDPLGRTAGQRGDLALGGRIAAPGQWVDSRCRRCPSSRFDATRVDAGRTGNQPAPTWWPKRLRRNSLGSACKSPSAGSRHRASSPARWTAGALSSRSTCGTRCLIRTSAPSGGRARSHPTATT